VATASAIVWELRLPGTYSPAAAVVGVAVGAAVLLLREAPMPAGYAAALLDKVRAEYLLLRRAGAHVPVSDHRFALVEGEFPEAADFSGNGLVAVVPGGAVIRTGVAEGGVTVTLAVLEEPPPLQEPGWDEVVEVSWRAAAGQASVIGQVGPDVLAGRSISWAAPPWPGDYRLRVHASGRDAPRAAGCSRPSSGPRTWTNPRSRRPLTAWTSTTRGTRWAEAWSRCSASPAAA
jgi:hypothetical protein